ncbi:GNAT family N-acetyltransferase [Leucobacter insecticola]|uniref:GNAT family N-acetyltransferase n=1 Tax=Leucobacter insecticola TaxID=2714934 RepID=A0A6G8FGS3_9MICO|nr:GNAT family N-acetyltransferase [Leucobacter insecticola]QIM15568.1 GNAT family N-acetyltransferase [Leucobacter insecticola]
MPAIELHTARTILTAPTLDDVPAIFEACQDPSIQRWTTVPAPYKREHAVGFVEHVTQAWESGEEHTWAIRHAGVLCGMIGLIRQEPGAAEIGYWVSPTARGQGLFAEAGRAVLDWGFAAHGGELERIEWRAYAGNVPSAYSARALGFRYEGHLRRGLPQRGKRFDGWIAGLLAVDDREPRPWPVLNG